MSDREPRKNRPERRDPPAQRTNAVRTSESGALYVDYKETETLRKVTATNGKILGRKRIAATAGEMRLIAQAVKRARYMALLPYTTAAQ